MENVRCFLARLNDQNVRNKIQKRLKHTEMVMTTVPTPSARASHLSYLKVQRMMDRCFGQPTPCLTQASTIQATCLPELTQSFVCSTQVCTGLSREFSLFDGCTPSAKDTGWTGRLQMDVCRALTRAFLLCTPSSPEEVNGDSL